VTTVKNELQNFMNTCNRQYLPCNSVNKTVPYLHFVHFQITDITNIISIERWGTVVVVVTAYFKGPIHMERLGKSLKTSKV
jgi:hypothetical protein